MRILIMGAGKMGSFFTDVLSFEHEVAVYDVDPKRLRFMYNCYRFTNMEEVENFHPELVINAATVKYTLDAFRQVLPHLTKDCIISDIASVKTGLKEFYETADSATSLLTLCSVLPSLILISSAQKTLSSSRRETIWDESSSKTCIIGWA